jgi:Tol biopolymer transport system component
LSPAWSPDGRTIAFVRNSDSGVGLYVVPAVGGTERPIANLRRRSAQFRLRILDWSGDGRALVVVDQNAPEEPFYILRVSIDTAERHQLTSPPPQSYGDVLPAVSADGLTLAFTRFFAPGTSDIFVLPIAGGEPRRLTFDDSVITGIAWSEDGRSLVFSSERGATAGAGSLWRIQVPASASGSQPEQLAGIGPRATAPAVARNGRLLAYQEYFQDTNLWQTAATGRESPQPVVSSTREENLPDYSPDGARIVFASNRSGNWEVWTSNADGSDARQVTSYAASPASNPRWSPNGRLLAFQYAVEGNADIYTMTPEGSSIRRLTTEPSREETPAWSRDGRWLYFASNRSGSLEIWKMAVAPLGQAVQVTRAGGMDPQESIDGRQLFYTKRAGAGLDIWSTGVNGGEEARVLGPIRSRAGWVPDRNGIYFIDPAWQIAYYRFATAGTTPIVTLPTTQNVFNPGLTLSPDGRWLLYGQMDRFGADVMLVENFR